MKLQESVEGCSECAADEEWLLSQGHKCGEPSPLWSTWCEVLGQSRRDDPEFHEMSHRPLLCDDCGGILDNRRGLDRIESRPCPSGQCVEHVCGYCGALISSSGPVGCPVCGSLPDKGVPDGE